MGAARLVNAARLPPDRARSGHRRAEAAPRPAASPAGARRRAGRHADRPGVVSSRAEGWDPGEGWDPEQRPAGRDRRPGRAEQGRDGAERGGAERGGAERGGAERGRADRNRAGAGRGPSLPDRALRGLAGVLAGGLVVLSLGLLVVWLLADGWGVPGPGGVTVAGHLVGAVVAVAGQRIADRRPGREGTLAALVVVVTAALVLGLAWFL